jgi:hypothetical protein
MTLHLQPKITAKTPVQKTNFIHHPPSVHSFIRFDCSEVAPRVLADPQCAVGSRRLLRLCRLGRVHGYGHEVVEGLNTRDSRGSVLWSGSRISPNLRRLNLLYNWMP